MNKQLPPANQSTTVKLINRIGGHLGSAGLVKPGLNVDSLIDRASKKTGLQNFGDESFRLGLEMLTAELTDQARLSQVGRLAAYFHLVDHLCVRLQLIDYRARRPEVASQQIKQPLFIMGLPRTGTTILYELIAQDPSFRSPASWEVDRPLPPALAESYENDKRIRGVDHVMALMEKLAPGFRTIHAIGARLPQECVYILASHFISEQFGYMYNIPKYRAWSLDQDMTASYKWHAHFLQHLQVDFSREHWVLKTPSHLAYLKYLFAQYPDAAVVWTHRQPLDALTSFSSLASTLHSGFSNTVDPLAVGEHEFSHFSKIVNMGIEQRRSLDQSQFFDVSFSALCSNPISVIGDIYTHFGMHLSREAEVRMRDYLKHRPRDLYGKHIYSSEDYGLERSHERSLYSEYLSHYGDYLQ